jgi:hypothetical protein
VANGLWVDRWVISPDLDLMTQRVQQVPLTMGNWVGKDDESNQALTKRLIDEGVLHALVSRVYKNTQTGQEVSFLMATGRPGPISTHNPLTCYNASGFSESSPVETSAIALPDSTATAEFSRCGFARSRASGRESLTVYWAWRSPKGWVPASDPRLAFASYRALTKIYVIQSDRDNLPGFARDKTDTATSFLQDCLPIINDTLVGGSTTSQETAATPPSRNDGPATTG